MQNTQTSMINEAEHFRLPLRFAHEYKPFYTY